MRKEPAPRKIDRVAGRLSYRAVFPVTYNVDRMYLELYLAVLLANGVKVDRVDVVKVNDGLTEQHTVCIKKDEVARYIGRNPGCIRRDSENRWYTKLFGVDEQWAAVQKDWRDHPEKWRDVWKNRKKKRG